jgi:transforming growth factor-beta-induced protein
MARRGIRWNLVAVTLMAAAGSSSSAVLAVEQDIVTTAVEAGSFQTLAAALKAAGLVETLRAKGPFTVFAPTDEAFEKLPAGTVETLLRPENKGLLTSVLTYHVVPGSVTAERLVKQNAAATVNGQRLDVKVEGSKVQVDQASVVKADIACSNGVIHVIDQVLLPSSDTIPAVAEKAGTFKTLLAAAKAAGLVDVLSGDKPLTVFAPNDDAFAKLPAGTIENLLKPENKDKLAAILKLHVVAGRVFSDDVLSKKELKSLQGGKLSASVKNGAAFVNGARLLSTDIDALNGVIHVIDTVLLPEAASKNGAQASPPRRTDAAQGSPRKGRAASFVVHAACRK